MSDVAVATDARITAREDVQRPGWLQRLVAHRTVVVGATILLLILAVALLADVIATRVMDGLMAFPAILLAIALMAVRGPGVANVIFALSVVYTPRTAMLIRSIVLSLREQDYVQAARALGRADAAIAVRHILPNCLAPVLVQASFVFAYAILAEAILGFPGLALTVAGLSLNLLGDGLRDTLDPRLRGRS